MIEKASLFLQKILLNIQLKFQISKKIKKKNLIVNFRITINLLKLREI